MGGKSENLDVRHPENLGTNSSIPEMMLGALRIVIRDHRGHRHYTGTTGRKSETTHPSGPNARIDRSRRPSGPTTPTRASFSRPIHPLSWLGKAAKQELGPGLLRLLRAAALLLLVIAHSLLVALLGI